MANDGAIDILINLDTVVDAQNAVKGVENLRKQVTQIFKHLGDDIVNGGLSKASTGLNKFITDFNDAWTSLPKNLQSQFDISSAFDVTNGVAKLQDLYNALSEIADKVRESSVEYQDLEAEIRNSRNEISALYATAMQDPNMAKGLALVEKMSTDSENAFKYLAQYNFLPAETKQSLNELFSMIDRVQEKIMEFTQEQANLDIGKLHISKEGPATELLTEFSQVAEITQTVIGNIEEMQSAYTQMTSQISSEYASSFGKLEDFGPKFTAIYNKITALGNKKVISPHAFDDMEAAIEKVKDSAQETKEKLVEMLENKKAFAAGDKASEQAEEQEYSRLIALVNDLNERYEEVVNHLNEVRDAANEAGDAQEDAGNRGKQASKNMNKDSAGLVGSIRKIAYTARAFNYMTRMIAEPFKAVWNILKKIGSAIWSLLGQVRQFMSRVASGILNVFKRAYAQIKKIFSKIISGFTGIFSKVHLLNFSFGSFVKAATSGLKKVLRLFMRFGLGARSSYFLIRRLRSAFIEMYKAAAEQIPEINKQVSSIMTGIQQLKGELVTAFQPLAEKAIPLLETVLDKMNGMLNALGQFNAALTGQGYIYEFIADEQDYAKSMQEAAEKTNKAKKATKEYQKALMGFDQINRLNDDKNKDDDDEDAYDPTASAKGKWVKKLITDKDAKDLAKKIKDLWKQIKDAWDNAADFTAIGELTAEKIEELLGKLNKFITTKLREWLTKGANALATFLNGFLTKDLAKKIGEVLGNLVNIIQDAIIKFFERMDWHKLGEFLATSLDNAIKTWDAGRFGRMIADFLIAAISTWWSFVSPEEGFDFEQLGEKIATAINNFVQRMNDIDPHTGLNHWQELGQAIVNTLSGLITTVVTAIQNMDWGAIRQALKDAIEAAVGATNDDVPVKIFNSLSDLLIKGIDKLITVAPKIMGKIALILRTALQEIDWSTALTGLTLLGDVMIRKLTQIVNSMNENGEFQQIGKKIADFIQSIDWGQLLQDLGSCASAILTGIQTALHEVLSSITPEDWSDFGTSLGNFLIDIVNSIDWKQAGQDLSRFITGLLEALHTALNTPVEEPVLDLTTMTMTQPKTVKDVITDSLREAFNSINWKDVIGDLAILGSDLRDIIGDVINGIIDDVKTDMGGVGSAMVTGLKIGLVGLGTIIAPFLTLKILAIIGIFKALFGIHSPSTVMEDIGMDIIQGLLNGIKALIDKVKELWEDIKTAITEKVEALKDKLNEAWTNIKEKATEMWENIKSAASEKWESIKSTVIETVDNIKTALSDKIANIKDMWETNWEKIKIIATTIWSAITEIVKGAVNGVIGFINGMISGVVGGLNAIIDFINSIKIDFPDWVPLVGGKSIAFSLNPITAPQIPALAKGAVIPPNKQFLAMLGDQSHGTNIEAPLATIEEAVANVMNDNLDAIAIMVEAVVRAINDKDMVVSIGDKEIGQAAARYTRKQNLIKGTV